MSDFSTRWFEGAAPRVVLDVGTFDAKDACTLKTLFPDCTVIAFEACPDNWGRLESRRAELGGIELVHAAVCDYDGEAVFHSNTDCGGPGMSGSMLAPTDALIQVHRHLAFSAPRPVAALRLDTFCQTRAITHVDLLHLDVQGAEAAVLRGLGVLRPRLIFLEMNEGPHYVGAASSDALDAHLRGLGYLQRWTSGVDALYALVSA
jgi:FkbM family methyltransferase